MLGKFSCWCFSPLWLVICQWKTVWVVVDIVTGVGQVWLTLSMWARDPGGWVRTVARGPLCLWSAGQWSSWQKVQWEVGCVLLSQDLQALSLVGEVGARGQAGDCALQAPQLLPGPPLARPRLWGDAGCWGPAPADPGNLKGRRLRRSGYDRIKDIKSDQIRIAQWENSVEKRGWITWFTWKANKIPR